MARSSGVVLLVRKPKIDEPAPVPMPVENTDLLSELQHIEVGCSGALERMCIIVILCRIMSYYIPKTHEAGAEVIYSSTMGKRFTAL